MKTAAIAAMPRSGVDHSFQTQLLRKRERINHPVLLVVAGIGSYCNSLLDDGSIIQSVMMMQCR